MEKISKILGALFIIWFVSPSISTVAAGPQDHDSEQRATAKEGTKYQPELGKACSEEAFRSLAVPKPGSMEVPRYALIKWGRGRKNVSRIVTDRRGGEKFTEGPSHYTPQGYSHVYDAKKSEKPDRIGEESDYRTNFEYLLTRALDCLAKPQSGGSEFMTALQKYLDEEVPEKLSFVWEPTQVPVIDPATGKPKTHQSGRGGSRTVMMTKTLKKDRLYSKDLDELLQTFDQMGASLFSLLKLLEKAPELASAIGDQLKLNLASKDRREHQFSPSLKALVDQLYKKLASNIEPGAARSLEGQDKVLFDFLNGSGRLSDVTLGAPVASYYRHLLVNGKPLKTPTDSKLSLNAAIGSTPNFFNGLDTTSSNQQKLISLLAPPFKMGRSERHNLEGNGYFWLDNELVEQHDMARLFGPKGFDQKERDQVMSWLNQRIQDLDAGNVIGHELARSTAHESLSRVKQMIEATDESNELKLDLFDARRSHASIQKHRAAKEFKSEVNEWDQVADTYWKLTGGTLPDYVQWRYYALHPSFKEHLNSYLTSLKSLKGPLTQKQQDHLKSLMFSLNHVSLVHHMTQDKLGAGVLSRSLSSQLNQNGTLDENYFKNRTGVDFQELLAALTSPREPKQDYLRKLSAVLQVGPAYKGDKVRNEIINQIIARNFAQQAINIVNQTESSSFFNFGKKGNAARDLELPTVLGSKQEPKNASTIKLLLDLQQSNSKLTAESDPKKRKLAIRKMISKHGVPESEALEQFLLAQFEQAAFFPPSLDSTSGYWKTDPKVSGALTTLIGLLDDSGNEPAALATKDLLVENNDRYLPEQVGQNLAAEFQQRDAIAAKLRALGHLSADQDQDNWLDEKLAELKHQVLMPPSSEGVIAESGMSAATRITLLNYMLPENEPALHALGWVRHHAATAEKEEYRDAYRTFSLVPDSDSVEGYLSKIDPDAHAHLVQHHQRDLLRKNIIEELLKNKGEINPKTQSMITMLAMIETKLEEGTLTGLVSQDDLLQYLVPVEGDGEAGDSSSIQFDFTPEFYATVEGLKHNLRQEAASRALYNPSLNEGERETLASDILLSGLMDSTHEKERIESEIDAAINGPAEKQSKANDADVLFGDAGKKPADIDLDKIRENVKLAARERLKNENIPDELDVLRQSHRVADTLRPHLGEFESRLMDPYPIKPSLDSEDNANKTLEDYLRTRSNLARHNANNLYRDYSQEIKKTLYNPDESQTAASVLEAKKLAREKASQYTTAISHANMVDELRPVIQNGSGNPVSWQDLKEKARTIRHNIAGEQVGIDSMVESGRRFEAFLKSHGINATADLKRSDYLALVGQWATVVSNCMFEKDGLWKESNCDAVRGEIERLGPDISKDITDKFLSELRNGGKKRVEDAKRQLVADFLKNLVSKVGGNLDCRECLALELVQKKEDHSLINDPALGDLGRNLLALVEEIDSENKSKMEITMEQAELGKELLSHFDEELSQIEDPGQQQARYNSLFDSVFDLINRAGRTQSRFASLARASVAEGRGWNVTKDKKLQAVVLGKTNDSFNAQSTVAWDGLKAGESPLHQDNDSSIKRDMQQEVFKETKQQYQRERQLVAMRNKFRAIGAEVEGSAVYFPNIEGLRKLFPRYAYYRWPGKQLGSIQTIKRKNNALLSKAGWSQFTSQGDITHREDHDFQTRNLAELRKTLDQAEQLGMTIMFGEGADQTLSAYGQFEALMSDANYRAPAYEGSWMVVEGNTTGHSEFDAAGNLVDVRLDDLEQNQKQHRYAYERAKDWRIVSDRASEKYSGYFSQLHHVINNFGNYGEARANPDGERLKKASDNALHYQHIMKRYGGIPVDDEKFDNAGQLTAMMGHEVKGMLIKERAGIAQAMRQIEAINEQGWTVIITIGTLGAGAYITTLARAARLVQEGRAAFVGGRLVMAMDGAKLGLSSSRMSSLSQWGLRSGAQLMSTQRWMGTLAASGEQATAAHRVLQLAQTAKHAVSNAAKFGPTFGLLGIGGQYGWQNYNVHQYMKQALEDFEQGKFDHEDPEYRKKFGADGKLWGFIDGDGDGIPDGHHTSARSSLILPSGADVWDASAQSFVMFAGMGMAAPLKLPGFGMRMAAINERVLNPGLHMAIGSVGSDLAFSWRRGQKEFSEVLVDAGISALLLAPGMGIATSPAFTRLATKIKLPKYVSPSVAKAQGVEAGWSMVPVASPHFAGRALAAGASATASTTAHEAGMPLANLLKQKLGYQTYEVEHEDGGSALFTRGFSFAQHLVFGWMMSEGGTINYIKSEMKNPNGDMAALKRQFSNDQFQAALSTIKYNDLETGYESIDEPLAVQGKSDLMAREQEVPEQQIRRKTGNEALLAELAFRSNLTVDAFAFGAQLKKAGVTKADLKALEWPTELDGDLGISSAGTASPEAKNRFFDQLISKVKKSMAHKPGSESPFAGDSVIPLKHRTASQKLQNLISGKQGFWDTVKGKKTPVEDSTTGKIQQMELPYGLSGSRNSHMADYLGSMYRRLYEVARTPEQKKLVLDQFRQNPSLIGGYEANSQVLHTPEFGKMLRHIAEARMMDDAHAMRGITENMSIDPQFMKAREAYGEAFAAYVLKQGANEPASVSLDYLLNQFPVRYQLGKVDLTAQDWANYRKVYYPENAPYRPTPELPAEQTKALPKPSTQP